MTLRPLPFAVMLLVAPAVTAQPLSRSFRRPAAAAPAAPPSTAGLSQPPPATPGRTGAAGAPLPQTPNRALPEPSERVASTTSSTYKVSAGDQLEIYVWGDDRLQRSLGVLPDGTFAFPLAGTIMAAGKTPNQIEAEISGLLAAQYKGVAPQVTVSVRQNAGMLVSIMGKVRGPSTISPARYVTVLDALALVGGPTDFADINNIVVLRRVNGKTQVLRTHLSAALKGKASAAELTDENNPVLQAGDTVVVP